MRILNKRSIFTDPVLSDFGNPHGLSTKLLGEVRSNPYSINICCSGGVMTISYYGDKYSIEDLLREELPKKYVGGNGTEVIKRNKYISYLYENGKNNYSIDFTRNNCLDTEFNFTYTVYSASDSFYIFDKIMDLTHSWTEQGEYSEWSNVLNEILCNIVQNTNIIEMYYTLTESGYILLDGKMNKIKEYRSNMSIEHVEGNIYKQSRDTQLTERDITELCKLLQNKNKLVEVTVIWFSGKSIYGLDLAKLEKNYNVRVILK